MTLAHVAPRTCSCSLHAHSLNFLCCSLARLTEDLEPTLWKYGCPGINAHAGHFHVKHQHCQDQIPRMLKEILAYEASEAWDLSVKKHFQDTMAAAHEMLPLSSLSVHPDTRREFHVLASVQAKMNVTCRSGEKKTLNPKPCEHLLQTEDEAVQGDES